MLKHTLWGLGGVRNGFRLRIYGFTDLRIYPPPSPSRQPTRGRASTNQVVAGMPPRRSRVEVGEPPGSGASAGRVQRNVLKSTISLLGSARPKNGWSLNISEEEIVYIHSIVLNSEVDTQSPRISFRYERSYPSFGCTVKFYQVPQAPVRSSGE